MSDNDTCGDASPDHGAHQPVIEPLPLPLDFEAFYLGHQQFFHAYAEIQLGGRPAAEDAVHRVFLEILHGWDDLLRQGDLEQRTLAVLSRHVRRRLEGEGRNPAFVISGPIAHSLRAIRDQLELTEGVTGLYEAITELPPRQFNAIVMRYVLGYPTNRVARYMGLDERTVGYHTREAKKRLATRLHLRPAPAKNKNRKGTGQ